MEKVQIFSTMNFYTKKECSNVGGGEKGGGKIAQQQNKSTKLMLMAMLLATENHRHLSQLKLRSKLRLAAFAVLSSLPSWLG